MIYALRKLIAFVFLGGMFWFIYQDLDNLDKPWFMHALGMIAIAFACFWLLVPMVVVWLRIRRRNAQNRERYRKWLADGGIATIAERPARNSRLDLEPGEQMYFHEKGTLYIEGEKVAGGGSVDRPLGHPSDVAFPGYRRNCHVCQRTHCYITNRRVVFVGKELDIRISLADLRKFSIMPGGIVFDAAERLAYTFQNPLVAADVLRFAKEGG